MRKSGVLAATLSAFWLACAACTHPVPSGSNEDRYPSKVQLLEMSGCQKLDGLRRFEHGLFNAGFLREVVRPESPVAFELVDRLLSGDTKLIAYRKSDYERLEKTGSEPYREIVNRYELAACEETGGALYLVVVRHDPDPKDNFLGARFSNALRYSGCIPKPVTAPRSLGFYTSSTEDDLIRHIKRGLCKEYALGN